LEVEVIFIKSVDLSSQVTGSSEELKIREFMVLKTLDDIILLRVQETILNEFRLKISNGMDVSISHSSQIGIDLMMLLQSG
jgi:hypothetical protein